MSILEYNGGSVVALRGKECVAIASDMRFGVQATTVGMSFPKVFPIEISSSTSVSKVCVGLSGLATDIQTVSAHLEAISRMAVLESPEVTIKPQVLASRLSSLLYAKRFSPWFVEPIVAGIDTNNLSFICSMDLIGCINFAEDFVVTGTASNALFGLCESLWAPDMSPDQLFEVASQALLAAANRDAFTGWGAVVHIITPQGRTVRHIESRMD